MTVVLRHRTLQLAIVIVASVNNAGPGLGKVGPVTNYQTLTDFQTWVCSVAMLLGRLEILAVLVIFMPAFWGR